MTDHQQASPVRRPVVLAAVLLVVAAVLLVALRSWLDRPVVDEVVAAAPAVQLDPPAPIDESETIVEQTFESAPPTVAAEVPLPSGTPAEPLKVVLLPARVENPDPAAEFLLDTIRQATLRILRGMPGIEVIEISGAEVAAIVPPNSGPLGEDSLVSRAIRQRYDADVVAEMLERSLPDAANWSIDFQVHRSTGGWMRFSNTFSKTGTPAGNDVESTARRFAESVARDFGRVTTSSGIAGESRSILSDATRSEQERLRALSNLQNEGFDSGTLAAAVDLASRSSSAATRQRVWTLLRQGTYDVTLAQTFSYSLLTDPDATVRREAALGLGSYLSVAGSQAVLERAARSDSSADVRLAARMAMMEYDEQQAFRRATLLDRTLTPAERLAPTIVAGRSPVMPFAGPTTESEAAEEALAYAEILSGTDETNLQLRALTALQATMLMRGPIVRSGSGVEPQIVGVLIDLEGSPDANVRRAALQTMLRQSDIPEIRAVLESVAENEPELAEELGIPGALERRSLPGRATLPDIGPGGFEVEARFGGD